MESLKGFVSALPGSTAGLLVATPEQAGAVRYHLVEWGYLGRAVRGAKMPTVAAVFDEFAAAFQFPYYFGENKDAFDECMRDLDDFLDDARGYVVVVRDAERLLSGQPAELSWFVDAMSFYSGHWGRPRPIAAGGSEQGPKPFRIVLQVTEKHAAELTRRWEHAGGTLVPVIAPA